MLLHKGNIGIFNINSTQFAKIVHQLIKTLLMFNAVKWLSRHLQAAKAKVRPQGYKTLFHAVVGIFIFISRENVMFSKKEFVIASNLRLISIKKFMLS